MRRSSTVTLTMLPMLATAAVAAADPPERAQLAPPGMTQPSEPNLSPPGMTPDIWHLTCDDDPNWRLRPDCAQQVAYGGGVIRGGFGGYFHLGGSGSSGGSGSNGGSRASGGG